VSIPTAVLKAVLVGAIIVVPAVEAGSWFITKLQLEDDAAGAAVVAADAVGRDPIDARTAKTAFDVAQEDLAQRRGGEIEPATFRLFDDGTVRFTAQRSAPSPLLGHLDWTKDLMDVSAEVEGSPVD
jgi:hypothetical protein